MSVLSTPGLMRDIDRLPPIDPTQWHRWHRQFIPVIAIDGRIRIGHLWRRFRNGRYQYQKRYLSDEELINMGHQGDVTPSSKHAHFNSVHACTAAAR